MERSKKRDKVRELAMGRNRRKVAGGKNKERRKTRKKEIMKREEKD